MHPDACSTNTENTVQTCALAGDPNECLAYPDDASPRFALAVNSVVGLDLSPFLAQLVKTRFSGNGENESWECHAGRSRGSSSWRPFGGWRQVFRWPKYRVAWR